MAITVEVKPDLSRFVTVKPDELVSALLRAAVEWDLGHGFGVNVSGGGESSRLLHVAERLCEKFVVLPR
jgi:hypothetical protein